MASRSKNKSSKTPVTKKRTKTKSQSKRRTVRKKKKQDSSTKGLRFSLLLFVMVSLVAFGYYLGQNENVSVPKAEKKNISQQKASTEQKTLSVFSKVETKPQERKKAASPSVKQIHKHNQKKEKKKTALAYRSKKPKLVIIIDDVSNRKQLNRIKALNMPITPSIFPPSHLSMRSHTLAKNLKHYMIHLPMESGSAQFNKQYKTLKTSFSRAQMEARIKEIRKLFPKARYINNHTGSVFTDNYKAMQTLYDIMKKEGFVFIDSRTIGSTKVRRIAHKYGDAYVARDIFIDNIQTIPYIHRQLKKAVEIAKKKGYAIAIGHPHKITMQALASGKRIFENVELVYIDQIYQQD